MRSFREFVGVTYGEFQSWYNYGEIRLSADRLISLEVNADNESVVPDITCPSATILLDRLPQLNIDDEEGLLLIQLAPMDGVDCSCGTGPYNSRIFYIPTKRIELVIPLTERARRLLEPRLASFGISLSQPFFDKLATEIWFRMRLHNAWRGGDALVDTLFDAGENSIGNALRLAAAGGVRKLDLPEDEKIGHADTTWVTEAYTFTRHKPHDQGDINYLYDAGSVLAECAHKLHKNPTIIKAYRDIATKDINKRLSSTPLSDILADASLKEAADVTETNFKDVFPASLYSLIIFLRWKDLFHKNGNEVDFQGLIDDCPKFVRSAGFEPTVIAVWLLGCFAGYEGIAPFVYSSNPESYAWFTGSKKLINKLQKPEETESTQSSTSKIGGNEDLYAESLAGENDSSQAGPSSDDVKDKAVEKNENSAEVVTKTITKGTNTSVVSATTIEEKSDQEDNDPKSSGQNDSVTNEESSKSTAENQQPTSSRPAKGNPKKKATKKTTSKRTNSTKGRKQTPSESDKTDVTTRKLTDE